MSAWLLPDHIADVLPSEARHIEELRRELLDTARAYGYELVIPPLIEHLDSLLTGTGEALGLQTFKLVDQLSGRTLGLRADTTPQTARIDAHLLGRGAVTRLCYCGPVLHTRPERAHATREPLQLGAEIYGYAGREADLEVLSLALDCLRTAPVDDLSVDLADARILRALLAEVEDPAISRAIRGALASKDARALAEASQPLAAPVQAALLALLDLYGDVNVLAEAAKALQIFPAVGDALTDLRWLTDRLEGVRVTFDLAEASGWGYYSGPSFSIYADGLGDALLRGGRYDGVGAVFGHKRDRKRPAVGFSLDLKQLVRAVGPRPLRAAICAPWGDAPGLLTAVAALRSQGETVISVLPGQEGEMDEFTCDRKLTRVDGRWVVQSMD